ncbi:hypothetical protein ACFL13_02355 [Patescibacteria group bacterium]
MNVGFVILLIGLVMVGLGFASAVFYLFMIKTISSKDRRSAIIRRASIYSIKPLVILSILLSVFGIIMSAFSPLLARQSLMIAYGLPAILIGVVVIYLGTDVIWIFGIPSKTPNMVILILGVILLLAGLGSCLLSPEAPWLFGT